MANIIRSGALALLCVTLLPASGFAAMSDEEAARAVQAALQSGESADGILEMLVEDGRELPAATPVAVAATATPEDRYKLARAGICAARDASEAEAVGSSLYPMSADETWSDNVSWLISDYISTRCRIANTRPAPYTPDVGGGVSRSIPFVPDLRPANSTSS